MRHEYATPRSRKSAKALHVLRAVFHAKPKKARKAGKRAAREFDRLHPKPKDETRSQGSFA